MLLRQVQRFGLRLDDDLFSFGGRARRFEGLDRWSQERVTRLVLGFDVVQTDGDALERRDLIPGALQGEDRADVGLGVLAREVYDLIVKTFMRTVNWTSAMNSVSDTWNALVE